MMQGVTGITVMLQKTEMSETYSNNFKKIIPLSFITCTYDFQ